MYCRLTGNLTDGRVNFRVADKPQVTKEKSVSRYSSQPGLNECIALLSPTEKLLIHDFPGEWFTLPTVIVSLASQFRRPSS